MVWNRGLYYTTRIDGSSLLLQNKVIHANQCVWAGSVGSSGRAVREEILCKSTVDSNQFKFVLGDD